MAVTLYYYELGGYKYITAHEFEINVPFNHVVKTKYISLYDGILTIRENYAWDGASGLSLDTPSSMIPALVHDALYQLMRSGDLPQDCKDKVDRLFYDLLIKHGMNTIRAWYWYQAVKVFGKNHCKVDHRPLKPLLSVD